LASPMSRWKSMAGSLASYLGMAFGISP
jgi:hypothetical protein